MDDEKLTENELLMVHGHKIVRITEHAVVGRVWGRDLPEMVHEQAMLAMVLGKQGLYSSRGYTTVDGPYGVVYTTEVEVPR